MAQISTADFDTVNFYDPAAIRRAESLDVDIVEYLSVAGDMVRDALETVWYPNSILYRGRGTFNPLLIKRENETIRRLEVLKAVELFYETIVTDPAAINEVDKSNHAYSQLRYEREWNRAVHLGNFYDFDGDGTIEDHERPQNERDSFGQNQRWY